MKTLALRLLAFPLGLCLGGSAAAQSLDIQIDPAAAQAAGVDADQAERTLSQSIDQDLKVGDQTAFMEKMARATALSTRGMGVDYASNLQKFVVGASFGSAVNGAGAQFGRGGDIPEGGFAAQISLMAGINLGMKADDDAAARRFRLFVNGMAARPRYDPFAGSLLNYGAHLQIQLVKPTEGEVVRWGGLALTAGYEHSSFTLDLEEAIPIESGDLRWDATGTYRLQALSSAVPVELSTNLRILVATAYGGIGFDSSLDSFADSEAVLDGGIQATAGQRDAHIGTATLTLDSVGLGDRFVPRAFVGVQANLLMIKAYGQLNLGLEGSFGGHLGLRVAI